MDHVRISIADFRQTLRELRDLDQTRDTVFSIHIPNGIPFLKGGPVHTNCADSTYGPIHTEPLESACNPMASQSVTLNRADFEALLYGAAIVQANLEIWTAYFVNPAATLVLVTAPGGIDTRKNSELFVKSLLRTQSGGTLRMKTPLEGMNGLTSDIIGALRYVLDNQQTLCSAGRASPENRRGFLFSLGQCVSVEWGQAPKEQQIVEGLEAILDERPIYYSGFEKYPVRVHEFIAHPLTDLKDLAPMTFSDKGRLTNFNPSKLSSVFSAETARKMIHAEDPVPPAVPE